jgi:hypothetical protein
MIHAREWRIRQHGNTLLNTGRALIQKCAIKIKINERLAHHVNGLQISAGIEQQPHRVHLTCLG